MFWGGGVSFSPSRQTPRRYLNSLLPHPVQFNDLPVILLLDAIYCEIVTALLRKLQSEQLDSPAALSLGKEPSVPLSLRIVGPQGKCRRCEEEEKILPFSEIQPSSQPGLYSGSPTVPILLAIMFLLLHYYPGFLFPPKQGLELQWSQQQERDFYRLLFLFSR
jgi:hypothetical protein